ncbi:MAG: group II truncated hemoglobin [Phycisphaerales bacterium]|nr:group II truncated hemoglobin [Phycisphaerales bacterium]
MTAGPGPGQPAFSADHTPYEALGGEAAVGQLAKAFYETMDRNPAYAGIRELHGADLSTAEEKFRQFLSGWLGGPQLYVQQYGHPRLRMRHAPFPIGESERDQWLACMAEALDACDVRGPIRDFLDARFAHVADFMRNRAEGSGPSA